MLQLGCGRIVTTIACRLIDRCLNVDFSSDEQFPVVLSVLEELCASSRYRNRHAFQKNQRMYDCKTLQFSNTQQIMPDPEAAVRSLLG